MNDIDVSKLQVTHNAEARRFEVRLGEHLAMIEYDQVGDTLVYYHTEVPPAFEGMGIASKLARFALDYAQQNGFKVRPDCSFIAGYVRKHPEYQPITYGYF
ncbi:MAG: GNAT family N-acetyltransferase [Candidatus Flexifilum sp.]|jgi:predicted GNAT family acetyltransferase